MSSTRFARSGRVRICILMSMFVVLIMMIVIYQMSQHQLDESRAFQEGLNVQMQSLTAEKLTAEKRMNVLRTEKERYENQLAESIQKQQETERALQEKFDGELEKYKLLEFKYSELEGDCVKSKKKHLEDTNSFDQKLKKLLADVHKDKASKEHEVAEWKKKHDRLQRESEHKIHALEATLTEYKGNCHYIPKVQPAEAPAQNGIQQQLNKPAEITPTTRHSSPSHQAHSIDKPRNDKSFNAQMQVSEGLYRIGGGVNLLPTNQNQTTYNTNTPTNRTGASGDVEQQQEQLPLLPFAVRNNHSLILNSVENFQIVPKSLTEKQQQEEPQLAGGPVSPLSAPRKSSSTAGAVVKSADDAPNASVAPRLSSSSSGLPPLALPPAKPERKLPENVAPIPENFEDNKVEAKDDAVDVDTAAEELPKNENNNRYANVVNDLENNKNLGVAPKPIEDSGAHEVKDAMNEPSFNLPAAGQNLFDGELPAPGPGPAADDAVKQLAEAAGGGEGDDDDDVGDVAVKQPQHLLDTDNLNNEIAADQGKEFAEGIHLEDAMDEDQDEDDYSNVARKKGGEAIRN
ncbi:uncharacterized protein LOC6591691 isoform X4 [Drosophila persimilis]|uniref:uncharacterized protein LOC6591691 isoform X4 n=1 Tax=Drosophila persimilis TaxID=7234 RepID=UPI000F08F2AF|nr:uncharacterized protein LOC6591691 isoform X4 [Drosophila persimilis]